LNHTKQDNSKQKDHKKNIEIKLKHIRQGNFADKKNTILMPKMADLKIGQKALSALTRTDEILFRRKKSEENVLNHWTGVL